MHPILVPEQKENPQKKLVLEISRNQFTNLQHLLVRAREAKTIAEGSQIVQAQANDAYVNTAAAAIADAGGPGIGEQVRIDGLREQRGKCYIDVTVPDEPAPG